MRYGIDDAYYLDKDTRLSCDHYKRYINETDDEPPQKPERTKMEYAFECAGYYIGGCFVAIITSPVYVALSFIISESVFNYRFTASDIVTLMCSMAIFIGCLFTILFGYAAHAPVEEETTTT